MAYLDRSQGEIQNDIKKEQELVDKPGIGIRDDIDVYESAITTLKKYINEGIKEFETNGQYGTEKNNIAFAFAPYEELLIQFQEELNTLEQNNEFSPMRSNAEIYVHKLAARIDNAERETLIKLEAHDAKYEMIHGSSIFVKDWEDEDGAIGHYERMINAESIPGDSRYSYISTPPFLTGAANGKNFSEVLADIKSNNPDLTPGMTYTLDYSRSLDPNMGTIIVDADGKYNGEEVPVYEGVRVYSSRFTSALDEYNNYQEGKIKKSNTKNSLQAENKGRENAKKLNS